MILLLGLLLGLFQLPMGGVTGGGGGSGYSVLQWKSCSVSTGSPSTSCTSTWTSTTGTGNTIVIGGVAAGSVTFTVADSASQTYTAAQSSSFNCPFSGRRCGMYYFVNSAATTTFTCTTAAVNAITSCVGYEIKCASTCALDQSATSMTSNTTWTSNSITPTGGHSVALGLAVNATHTATGSIIASGGGFTLPASGAEPRTADADIQMLYQILSSTSAVQMSGTSSPAGDTVISTILNFK